MFECPMEIWLETCNVVGGPKNANPLTCLEQENDGCSGMRRTHQCSPNSADSTQGQADSLMNCFVSTHKIEQ